MIKIGIVGAGTIGSELAKWCVTEFRDDVRLVGIVDSNAEVERAVRKQVGIERKISLDELIRRCDLLIEAASAESAYGIAKQAITSGKDVMIMSAGGLIHHQQALLKLTASHRSCVYVPSGAVTGLDGLKSANIGKIKRVELCTRKAPTGFLNAPYIKKNKIDLNLIKEETVLFEGTAEKAVLAFPQNINISAALSLAGVGPKKTRVKISVCPGLTHHIHEVIVEGEFGSFYTRTQNLPSKQNPKTSRMAILSAVATLRRILGYVKVGT